MKGGSRDEVKDENVSHATLNLLVLIESTIAIHSDSSPSDVTTQTRIASFPPPTGGSSRAQLFPSLLQSTTSCKIIKLNINVNI